MVSPRPSRRSMYVGLRFEKCTEEMVQLVSDNIQYYSDSSYKGKDQLLVCLKKTKYVVIEDEHVVMYRRASAQRIDFDRVKYHYQV